ncbi:GNAT family N-acetyltransferase [Sulfitobacter guttiformis]|nr:GNAT family N-acetyltransferase [Sulfitobacter guttiformis]
MQLITAHPLTLPLFRLRNVLLGHYRRLSNASRRLRFMGGVNTKALEMIAKASVPDLILGIKRDGAYRAVLELFVLDSTHAEVGLSVEDAYQGQGFGRALFQRGITEARLRDMETIELSFLPSNVAIRKLCVEAGGDIHCSADDCVSHIRIS